MEEAPAPLSAPAQPASRRTMASILAERIRGDVLSGELKPGRRLNLKDVSKKYDAGTIPLREALSRLSANGFITAEDQKGFRVADISAEEVLDIHKQRAELECLALRDSIRLGTVQWEAELIAAHHTLSRIQAQLEGRPLASNPEWEVQHIQFHLKLVSACGSKWLMQFIRTLIEHSSRYRQVGAQMMAKKPPMRDIGAEHQAILDAALRRDVDLACALLRAHYRESARIVVGLIQEYRAGPDRK
jgi:GntR family carbon starvation induced transcriptional regulator